MGLSRNSDMATELTQTPATAAPEVNGILDALRLHGLNEVAVRLVHLKELLDEDPDELDLVIESLRSFAEFIIQEPYLPVPEIGAGPEGFVEAEWRISPSEGMATPNELYWGYGDGILAMKFLPTGLIRFAATSGPAGRGKERLRTSGILPRTSILPAVKTFISCLVVP